MTKTAPDATTAVAEATKKLHACGMRPDDDTIRFVEALKMHMPWMMNVDEESGSASNEIRREAIKTLRDAPVNLLIATAMLLTVYCSDEQAESLKEILTEGLADTRRNFIVRLTQFIRKNASNIETGATKALPRAASRAVH